MNKIREILYKIECDICLMPCEYYHKELSLHKKCRVVLAETEIAEIMKEKDREIIELKMSLKNEQQNKTARRS